MSSCFFSESIDLTFDNSIYQERILYEDAQETNRHLVYVGLTRELFNNESLTIVGNNVSAFFFNKTSLSVVNRVRLSPGRHEFTLVLISPDTLVSSSVVLNVLVPSKFMSCCFVCSLLSILPTVNVSCEYQLFGKCSQLCRQGIEFEFGYECYCEKGYTLLLDHRTCLVFGN